MIFLDTSAVLNGALYNYPQCCISPITLQELECIKNAKEKSEEIKFQARRAIRKIIGSKNIYVVFQPTKKIKKLLQKYDFLSSINDHYILCTAVLEAKTRAITFVTSDSAQYLFAKQLPELDALLFNASLPKENSDYCGWKQYYLNDAQLSDIYSDPSNNILKCQTNEFAEIIYENELKDVLFWNGQQYTPLKYKNIKNPYTEEVVKPRNLEQKMMFHILQNQDIKVKLFLGSWGSGKTKLALDYALEQINKGAYDKLIFVRNNIIVAGTKDIGFLPGNVREKLMIFALCIADHVGGEAALEELMDRGLVEVIPLSHIRGRSIRNSIVLCDECENMDDKLVTLLMSRIEESSELIFCGDVAQIDDKKFEEHNGIRSMLSNLAGNPLFGAVKLIKSERGKVASLCDNMIPPK